MSADPRSWKQYKTCRFEIKSMQPGLQSMLQSIATCWSLSVGFSMSINLKKQNPFRSFQLQFEKRLQKVIVMHARKRSLPLAHGETWRSIEDIFLKSKTSSRFPNFDANGCFGKYTTTHERVFFLGKSCSWTLLPKSIWHQMPLTWLWYISYLRSFRTHFASSKSVDDLRVYQGFMMPLNHQAQGTLKQCLRY